MTGWVLLAMGKRDTWAQRNITVNGHGFSLLSEIISGAASHPHRNDSAD